MAILKQGKIYPQRESFGFIIEVLYFLVAGMNIAHGRFIFALFNFLVGLTLAIIVGRIIKHNAIEEYERRFTTTGSS